MNKEKMFQILFDINITNVKIIIMYFVFSSKKVLNFNLRVSFRLNIIADFYEISLNLRLNLLNEFCMEFVEISHRV